MNMKKTKAEPLLPLLSMLYRGFVSKLLKTLILFSYQREVQGRVRMRTGERFSLGYFIFSPVL